MRSLKLKHWIAVLVCIAGVVLIGPVSADPPPGATAPQGASWQFIGPPGGRDVFDVDVDPQRPARLYASTTDGIFRSVNGGSDWDLSLAGYIRALVVNPQKSDVLYAGPLSNADGLGVHKSQDGGDSWVHYDQGMTCTDLAALSIAATNPSILFTGSF